DCIFTNTSTSLSLGWRQCGHRYAIRAGRNLPDKEFRYLRTVIVTAAVYRGFNQELAPHHLTFRHGAASHPIRRLSSWQSAVFLLNSRSHRFFATPLGSPCTGSPTRGTPYPEVTVSICRVPSPEFSQAPEHIQLAHLCRFAVRSLCNCSLEAFPGSRVSATSSQQAGSRYHALAKLNGFAYRARLHASTGTSNTRPA